MFKRFNAASVARVTASGEKVLRNFALTAPACFPVMHKIVADLGRDHDFIYRCDRRLLQTRLNASARSGYRIFDVSDVHETAAAKNSDTNFGP